jgi:hypothetical protein
MHLNRSDNCEEMINKTKPVFIHCYPDLVIIQVARDVKPTEIPHCIKIDEFRYSLRFFLHFNFNKFLLIHG